MRIFNWVIDITKAKHKTCPHCWFDIEYFGEFKVKYCPFCGRSMKEKGHVNTR